MRKLLISILLIVVAALCAAESRAAYMIILKNGGTIITSYYRYEGKTLVFSSPDGMVGISREDVARIESADVVPPPAISRKVPKTGEAAPAAAPAPAQEEGTQLPSSPASPSEAKQEKVDIQGYQDRMAELRAQLNESVERMQNAMSSQDKEAEAQARADMRRISAEIYRLTDELKAKNQGKLPEDWWKE
ncbi:MAG: hypothetical protein PHY31_06000 [Smithellaceae bacterium]|nr:hypothetical protein [Smithellaceae bacterium]